MSSRRSSRSSSRHSSSSGSSRITDEQINELVSNLQRLLPEMRSNSRRSDKRSATRVLQETCNYIKSLHREVDDLSERLSQLLANTDADDAAATLIRTLLTQL